MDDAVWEQIMATQTGTDAPAVDEAATTAAAPEAESPLAESAVPEVVADTTPEPEPAVAAEPAPEPAVAAAPDPAPALPPDWRETPEGKEALAALEFKQRITTAAEQARRLQAQAALQNEFTELSDGDTDRLQRLNNLATQIATPLQQAAQQQFQRAEGSEKAAAALFIAMEAELDDAAKQRILDRHSALMRVDGVEVMQQLAYGERDFNQKLNASLAAKDAEIAELRKQVAAQGELARREATGADAVDGGGGASTSPDSRDRMRTATSMDEYFDAMFGRNAA